jgi:prepilin-type N-terminal cleavage/methylation domain-containing protein
MKKYFRNFTLISERCTLNPRSGFTLIELLIVIAIIGILSGLLMVNFSGTRERARDTKRKTDLQAVKTALQLYASDFSTFPAANANRIAGCGAAGTTVCAWGSGATAGSQFSAGNPLSVYMGALPGDPLSPTQQYVYATSATVDYTISATLENRSDPDIQSSQIRCGVGTPAAGIYMVCNQ